MTYRRQCEKWDCKHWKTGCNCLSYPGLWHFIPIANSCNSHLQREIKRALQQVLTWHFGFVAVSSFCIYFKEALAALLTLPLSACVTPMKVSSSLHICFNYNKYTLKIFQSRTINSVFMAEGTAASSSELGIWFMGRRCCWGCCRIAAWEEHTLCNQALQLQSGVKSLRGNTGINSKRNIFHAVKTLKTV